MIVQKNRNNSERGVAMLIGIILMVAMTIGIMLSGTIALSSEIKLYRTMIKSKRAIVAADASIDDALYRVAYNKPISSQETIALNGATSSVNIVSSSANTREFYSAANADGEQRKSYAVASKVTTGTFAYGAQVGEGGIVMNNNSAIDGTGLANGDVYSGGQVSGGAGTTIEGDVIVSSGIYADGSASSSVCSVDEEVGKNNPTVDFAQSFVVSGTTTDELGKVSLYIKKNGAPSGANIRITTDNGGKPNTTALATQALDGSLVSTSYGWVDTVFTSPATLTPGVTYWLVLDSTQQASKYWYWCRASGNNYASGQSMYKTDWSVAGAWTSVAGDMAFKIYMGGGISKFSGIHATGIVKADVISSATITGDAYYQSISGSTVSGTSYPGSPTPPEIALPISSSTIEQWKTEATNGGVINGNCGSGGVAGCNTFPLTIGPKKINGNFLMDNNQTLKLSGVLYVTGTVSISNNSHVQCDASYGTKSCMIIADGAIDVGNNAIFAGSGFSGSYILVLTTKSGCIGTGTVVSGCASGNSGINISNNANGALFYAADSMVLITNNAAITAVVGYKVQLDNNTAINYDGSLMSTNFSTAATSTVYGWNVNRWSESF